VKRRDPRVLSERQGRWLINLFPPLLFNRIRVVEIGPGCRSCRVRVARSRLTRNLHGTTFGGTIYTAVDPFHALMYWQVFARRGERVQVWLRRARIDYVRPAASALELRFELTDEDIEQAVAALASEGRCLRNHRVEALDDEGRICAIAETEVYLRRPHAEQREVSVF